MKPLHKTIEEILGRAMDQKAVNEGEPGAYKRFLKELVEAIKSRDAFCLGEEGKVLSSKELEDVYEVNEGCVSRSDILEKNTEEVSIRNEARSDIARRLEETR